MKNILSFIIRGYQLLLSPLLGQRCRFYPSCSHYALEAIEIHGPTKGCELGLKRLAKCHPWHDGGVDLVPEKVSSSKSNIQHVQTAEHGIKV